MAQTSTNRPSSGAGPLIALTTPANPGASGVALICDGPVDANGLAVEDGCARMKQANVWAFIDRPATLFHRVASPGSSNLRVVNGSGSGDAISAAATGSAKATGALAVPAKANLLNNEYVTIGYRKTGAAGAITSKVFEFRAQDPVKATGSITCVAKASLADNDYFTLDDGVNPAVKFAYQVTANAYAVGSITCVAKANLVDGETFTLNDGVNPAVVFEFDVTGNGVTAGRTAVDVSAATDAPSVAVIVAAAINGVGALLAITATAPTTAVVSLTNDAIGTAGNQAISETVAAAGFLKSNMAGGSAFTLTVVGATIIDASGSTTAASVATITQAAINGVGALLAITSSAPAGAVLTLTRDNTSIAGNATVTENVANAGFLVTGMTGGIADWTATAGRTVIDVRGATTNAQVAAVVKAVINASQSTVVAGIITVNSIALASSLYGDDQNITITENVADAGCTVSGMAGGTWGGAALFTKTIAFQPGRNLVTIEVGGNAATVFEVAAELADI